MKNAQEILDQLKTTAIQYAIQDDNGKIYANKETDNLMDVYSLEEEGQHFYGVYSDIDNIQCDSRTDPDEKILKAIEKILELGKLIPRNEIDFSNIQRTYFWN